jgi:hypothetical protein
VIFPATGPAPFDLHATALDFLPGTFAIPAYEPPDLCGADCNGLLVVPIAENWSGINTPELSCIRGSDRWRSVSVTVGGSTLHRKNGDVQSDLPQAHFESVQHLTASTPR